jgi:hypothetical protein
MVCFKQKVDAEVSPVSQPTSVLGDNQSISEITGHSHTEGSSVLSHVFILRLSEGVNFESDLKLLASFSAAMIFIVGE